MDLINRDFPVGSIEEIKKRGKFQVYKIVDKLTEEAPTLYSLWNKNKTIEEITWPHERECELCTEEGFYFLYTEQISFFLCETCAEENTAEQILSYVLLT